MRTGDLRRRITIQRRNATQDTFGQSIPDWIDVVTCWSSIDSINGRELVTAQAINAATTHEIVIRYRSGILAAMRILHGKRVFEILSVIDPDERRRQLTLAVSEGLTKG